jgi:hypothetical protein
MSTMLVELYDALKEAGASEQKARAAAKSLVLRQDRLKRIEQQTGQLANIHDQIDRAREDIVPLDKELAVIRAQIDLLKWMNGIVIAGVLALIIKTFFA